MNDIRKRPKAQTHERIRRCIDVDDYSRLFPRGDDETVDWPTLCRELADNDRRYADEQLSLGRKKTAKHFYGSGSYLYELGQYGFTDLVEEKLDLYRNHVDCARMYMRLGMELGLYDFEEVEIPYKGVNMDGYLLLPKRLKKDNPMLIVIPGATEFKDNFINRFEPIVQRGIACLLMDGPGQGTTCFFNGGMLELKIEHAYSAMIDYIKSDGRFGMIGMIGISTGGYYVPRVVGTDSRIDLCVINGGTYTPTDILVNYPGYRHKFAVLSGVTDEEIDHVFPKMNLAGYAENIKCPLLVLHGGKDPIFPLPGAEKLFNAAQSEDKTIMIYPDAFHCCGGDINKAWNLTEDWLAEHMLKS